MTIKVDASMGNLVTLDFPKRMMQKCPLCGVEQPMLVKGTCKNPEDIKESLIAADIGYSFCNCNNIFYTNWRNIDQTVYNDEYVDLYDTDNNIYKEYANKYFSMFNFYNSHINTFLEIGSINDQLLDIAKENGYIVAGLDIQDSKQKRKHQHYNCNFEETTIENKFDVIWAAHVFEHFKNPLMAIRKCYTMMNDKGLLFIAMPDPFFIDWDNVYSWSHWHVREHHIMWDMESFIKQVESFGFNCVNSCRNINKEYPVTGDYHLVFQK